jgi:hypothetical protein
MTLTQEDYIRAIIQNAKVDDIGCGHSRLKPMLELCDYLGVDKKPLQAPRTIQFDLANPCPHLRHDLAFVGWPINRKTIAWHLFLREYHEILYIGKNTDGIVCGDLDFWKIVSKREILKVLPNPSETLIHYGPGERKNQEAPLEERAAIATWETGELTHYPFGPLKTKLKTHIKNQLCPP